VARHAVAVGLGREHLAGAAIEGEADAVGRAGGASAAGALDDEVAGVVGEGGLDDGAGGVVEDVHLDVGDTTAVIAVVDVLLHGAEVAAAGAFAFRDVALEAGAARVHALALDVTELPVLRRRAGTRHAAGDAIAEALQDVGVGDVAADVTAGLMDGRRRGLDAGAIGGGAVDGRTSSSSVADTAPDGGMMAPLPAPWVPAIFWKRKLAAGSPVTTRVWPGYDGLSVPTRPTRPDGRRSMSPARPV
jgi:hypothetical protein